MTDAEATARLAGYEGLVCSTARMLSGVRIDEEDIQQLLRIKVFKALRRFDPDRVRGVKALDKAVDDYVFMCVADQKKTCLRDGKKFEAESYMEDLAPVRVNENSGDTATDRFTQSYLSVDHDEVYGAIEEEGVRLPNTLTDQERQIIGYLYLDYKQVHAARVLGIEKREMERIMKSIRAKLADWRPTPESTPTAPVALAA